MIRGLLPIGSVVLLGNSTKRVMIIGVAQRGVSQETKLRDYVGVVFPEGYLDSEKLFLFDNEQITQIYALGYQDAEQLAFKKKADELMAELRKQEG